MAVPTGLSLQPNAISVEKELAIIQWLDAHHWTNVNPSNPNSRRVQQFGYGYNYTSKSLTPGEPMAGPIYDLAQTFTTAGLMTPVQCIVNEYSQTQGISAHIDNKNFGPTVIGLSIGADAVMTFKRGNERFDCFLPQRSVMMMTGEARYAWTHEISSNKSYIVSGRRVPKPVKYRRISLTFRELA